MNRYTFDDGMQITANNDKEADLIYNDIIINRYNGETRPFEELNELAMKYYNANDDKAFYYFSDDELALLWSKCMFTNSHPWGQAYDDEIFDTIYSLSNKDEIMKKADEYADEEEKNFKGKPFFKTNEESQKRSRKRSKNKPVSISAEEDQKINDRTAEILNKIAQDLKKEYNIKDESLNESLASRLVDFIKDYDFYHYSDVREVGDNDEDIIKEMDKELSNPESAKKLLDSLIEMSKNKNLDDEQKDIVSSLISGVQSVVNNQKTESLKENMTIEDMFKDVGVKIVFDDKGHFTKEAEEKYNEVAKKFFDGNQDKLDKLCDEEKCFDESLKESSDENWAVFAKDKSTGKEYCSGVYESKNYAYYWATMDRNADLEYGYGDFEYRVEKVPEYSDELLKSSTELNNLKLANYDKTKEKDDESLKEKVENSYSYKNYVIINDSKANCWRIKDSKDNWVGNCFSTDKEAEEFIDSKDESLKEDIETPYFKAYITNLGKYNEGELIGEWVEFPIDEDDFNEVLKKIGVSDEPDADGNYYEEFFVTDYECNLNGFNWQDFGEYPSYDTLQEFGELIESIDDVEAVDNAYEVTGDLKEAIDGLEDGSIIYYPGIYSDSDLGYEIINQIYGDDIPKDTLDSYFDYEALGRDLSFNEYETDEEDEDGNTVYVNAGQYWCGDEYASDSDIGYAYVEEVGPDGVDNPENYFDYVSFGRDLTYGNFTLTSNGAIEYN